MSALTQQDRTLQGYLLRRALPPAYRYADHVIAVSEGVRQDLLSFAGLPQERVSVIYNPLHVQQITDMAAEPIEEPWLSDRQRPVIVAMGRLTAQKDFPTLVRALHQVRAKRDARLIILGEGEDRLSIAALVRTLGLEDAVRLPGHVANPFPYLRRARLFVLCSRWEGLPNALIQALVLGCPVISTRCQSGPEEILEHGRLGDLVPVGDASALATAIMRALERQGGATGPDLEVSLRRFSPTEAVQQYLHVLLPRHLAVGQ